MSQTSIRVRILVASAIGAMGCSIVVLGVTLTAVLGLMQQRMSDLETVAGSAGMDRCLHDPEHFMLSERLSRIWAYDPQGRSANPHAPRLPESVLQSARFDRSVMHTAPGGPFWRKSIVQRVGDDGPCAVLFATPPDRYPMVPWIRGSTMVGMFLGLMGALMATMALAVRPLVERLARLDAAARGVGMATFRSAVDPGDDEIGRISATLDHAHERIVADREERVRRQRALEHHLASVAHDLRTPLASLQLMLEDLAGPDRVTHPEGRDRLRDARLEVAYLEALADNLHQATRMNSGLAADEGQTNFIQMVDRVESRFAILGRLLGGTVAAARPDEPVWARIRPDLAERALANLVHNGVVHGSGDVGIVLTATADRFTIVVQSAGPHLDPALVASLSQRRLGRATDPARSRQGAAALRSKGLGIAIVNAVAERAGFDVRFEASDEGGLTVTLSGPRSAEPTAGSAL